MTRSTLLRAVYDGYLALDLAGDDPVRLQRYTQADRNVTVIGDLGGRPHPDDVPGVVLRHDVQLALYHSDFDVLDARAQLVHDTFAAYSEGEGGEHPWVLTGWTVRQLRISPPRYLGELPNDPLRRHKTTLDLTLYCATMT